jgi:hypothetical protein
MNFIFQMADTFLSVCRLNKKQKSKEKKKDQSACGRTLFFTSLHFSHFPLSTK